MTVDARAATASVPFATKAAARSAEAARRNAAVPGAHVSTPVSTILIVEENATLRRALRTSLRALGHRVLVAENSDVAALILQQESVDLVLADTPTLDSPRAQLGQPLPRGPRLVSLGTRLADDGGAAAGREDEKPAGARAQRRGSPAAASIMPPHAASRSLAMQQVWRQVERIGALRVPVLVTGETGVGKELIARALHAASGREPFVPVNCGAIPAGLLESELFGHVRGAFTGADRDRTGLFEAAHGGTIFLDEVAELPLALQSKLLRVLQSGELRRVGDVQPRYVDVRLIAATHRDLGDAVEAGLFREDLLYRINVLHIAVPPLRDRRSDIPLLVEHFLATTARREGQSLKSFSKAAMSLLIGFRWPGNVRQLQNIVERCVVLSESDVIDADDVPSEVRGGPQTHTILQRLGTELTLAELEREHILAVLDSVRGNRSRAARILGIPRRTLYRRLEEYALLAEDRSPLSPI